MIRYNPDLKVGLNSKQIDERIKNNLVNVDTLVSTKTIPKIISDNLFTLFNFLNLFLGFTIFLVGSYKNLTFLGVVFCNTLISTLQEIRSKKIVDKLSLLNNNKVKVIRNEQLDKINRNELVLDDLVVLTQGNQVPADSIIVDGNCEVNESFLTGESEAIVKNKNDLILAGSFIVQGKIVAKVERVGNSNYIATISNKAKYVKKVNSELMNSLNKVIKIVSIAIVPIGLLLFYNQINISGNTLENAVINTVAALIGMIPEGLVLLTSTVLAVSVIRLSKSNVLVQQLYCIETLARVDTICLDKTGTITEGYMEVKDVIKLEDVNINEILSALTSNLDDDNATIDAISRKYNKSSNYEMIEKIPFSSVYKFSSVTFKKYGTYVIGASEILLKNSKINKKIDEYSKDNRVVLLGHTNGKITKNNIPDDIKPLALILIQDKIRYQAKNTLDYLKKQGVDVKIISGDNVNTVKEISKRVGVNNLKAIDVSQIDDKELSNLVFEYGIFARVKPEQKKLIVESLQKKGHVVAMTGDGVNDVLALKASDCSIAMSAGSDAARNVSELVLLDSNFDAMKEIVGEGRRTINNIERSASLFLVKTIYASILALLFIFINMKYPFMPIQLTLTNMVTIGIPSFILALEPNYERIKGKFLTNVLSRSIPAALTIVLNIIIITIISKLLSFSEIQSSTLSVIISGFIGFSLLFRISKPFNFIRKILFITMIIIFLIGILGLRRLFSLAILTPDLLIIIFILILISIIIFRCLSEIVDNFIKKHPKMFTV